MRPYLTYIRFVFLAALCAAGFGYLVSRAERGAELGGTADAILAVARFPDLAWQALKELKNPSPSVFLRPSRCQSILELPVSVTDSNYVLTSYYDDDRERAVVDLVWIPTREIVYSWYPPAREILEAFRGKYSGNWEKSIRNFAAYHPLLLPDGSIVFNLMYGPLVRINRDSEIDWVLPEAYHHAIELDAEGYIWASRIDPNPRYDSLFWPRRKRYEDNILVQLDREGNILYEKSIDEILIENKLSGMLFGMGEFEYDPVHVNDIQPAWSRTAHWEKGDLLLSLRNVSCILLYRPSTGKVIWTRFGDWTNQHDVNYLGDDRISLFGNDMVRYQDEEQTFSLRGYNNLYVVDLENDSTYTPFARTFAEGLIYSPDQGRGRVLPGGRAFVEQTRNGTVMILDTASVRWRFMPCFADGSSSSMAWSRYVPAEAVDNRLLP